MFSSFRSTTKSGFEVLDIKSDFDIRDSRESSKRSSISENLDVEVEIIPRSIHALCTKKTKEFINQLAKKGKKMSSDELGEEVSKFYNALMELGKGFKHFGKKKKLSDKTLSELIQNWMIK